MARPFRFDPPVLSDGTLARPRLAVALHRRWDVRLVTVVAGPGFGKTAALVATLAQARAEDRGRDVWLACEPADAAADHLISGLLEASGLGPGALQDLLDWVWAQAPRPVCFVLDDLHDVDEESEGAAVLRRLATDLPANGHLLLASRDPVPVPVARLATSGQLVRVREDDLVLDDDELAAFAAARGVAPELLGATGGWPALAELTASARADLVLDYLWEEVLARAGPERAHRLARFALVGGGDDEVATAVAGEPVTVDDLVTGLPLVLRSPSGAAALHPLWTPPLRSLVTPGDVDAALRAAAGVHRRRQRFGEAVGLLAEVGAWEDVLAVIRDAAISVTLSIPSDFGRWYRALPLAWRDAPVALLARGIELMHQRPHDAIAPLEAAMAGFRAAGDVDAEAAAASFEGVVLWWANDVARLLGLHQRVVELASVSDVARYVAAIGNAAVAHLLGDSAGVFSALEGVDDIVVPSWRPVVQWLRSVAHRRAGDLEASLADLADFDGAAATADIELARLRSRWLLGDVDEVCAALPAVGERFRRAGDSVNHEGVGLELAAKRPWLGAGDDDLVLTVDVADATSPMVVAMRRIAEASIAIARDDEQAAAELLHDDAVATLDRPDGWYWRDRGAVALLHVLVPETRAVWAAQDLAPTHRVGVELAEALEAARAGDLAAVASLRWPAPGVARAHLPLPWVVELACAAVAAGNPASQALLDAVGDRLRPAVVVLARGSRAAPAVRDAAGALLATLPATPAAHLRVEVLGPLAVHRDGGAVVHADLRRGRVRELLAYLVVRRRARREEITDELWPDLDDRGRNLRVTLNYLQRVLQPDRPASDPPYHLRTDGPWLSLEGRNRLAVDLWELDELLDEAAAAERSGAPAAALAAYERVLPLWRGEPLADVPYADWAERERQRVRTRFGEAAIRAGELLLAAGGHTAARAAAQRALAADPAAEAAYQLLARAHLAAGDRVGAHRAVAACTAALAELGVDPSPATLALATPS